MMHYAKLLSFSKQRKQNIIFNYMKNSLAFFTAALLLVSCVSEQSADKQLVRDYLVSKNIKNIVEVSWSPRDSLFSPFNIELSEQYLTTRINSQISSYELDMILNRPGTKDYKTAKDSIRILKEEIEDIKASVAKQMELAKKNRVGIGLKFKYQDFYIHDWIFVLNNDGKTIGHVIENGKVLDL